MTKESISSVTGAHGATGKTTNSFAGKWALITGASCGLGLEFADLLAAQKVNPVLAARRRESMEKLASEPHGLDDRDQSEFDALPSWHRGNHRSPYVDGIAEQNGGAIRPLQLIDQPLLAMLAHRFDGPFGDRTP